MMIPQGTQKITARKTVGLCERRHTIQKSTRRTTVQDDSRASVSWESADAGSTQGNRDKEDREVHVLGNLTVVPHEASVDVLAVGKSGPAANQVLETSNDLTTVVEDGMGDCGGVNGKEHAVHESVGSGEVSRGVSLVTSLVEHGVLIDNVQDMVTSAGVVPDVVIVDGDVSGVPGVGIPNRQDNRSGDKRAEETIKYTVERIDEGVSGNGKLVPVPGREGV